MEAWQDLTAIYTRLGLWPDADICVEKAKLIEFYSPGTWHATGRNNFCYVVLSTLIIFFFSACGLCKENVCKQSFIFTILSNAHHICRYGV